MLARTGRQHESHNFLITRADGCIGKSQPDARQTPTSPSPSHRWLYMSVVLSAATPRSSPATILPERLTRPTLRDKNRRDVEESWSEHPAHMKAQRLSPPPTAGWVPQLPPTPSHQSGAKHQSGAAHTADQKTLNPKKTPKKTAARAAMALARDATDRDRQPDTDTNDGHTPSQKPPPK
eukprot:COSAG01_NODE_2874_length_6937_cov_4.473823_11_plen_179_part_00